MPIVFGIALYSVLKDLEQKTKTLVVCKIDLRDQNKYYIFDELEWYGIEKKSTNKRRGEKRSETSQEERETKYELGWEAKYSFMWNSVKKFESL